MCLVASLDYIIATIKRQQIIAEKIADIREKQLNSTQRYSPTEDEEVGASDVYIPSPLCPTCGNLDPCSYLNRETLDAIDCTEKAVNIPTSVVVITRYSTSGDLVKCLVCDHRFHFCAYGNPYNLTDDGPKNMGKVSKLYLKRLVLARIAEITS